MLSWCFLGVFPRLVLSASAPNGTSTESTLAAVRPWSFGYIWPYMPRFDDLTSPSTHGMHETYEGGWNVGPFPTRGEMKGCRIGSSTLCFPLQVTSFGPAMGVLMMQVWEWCWFGGSPNLHDLQCLGRRREFGDANVCPVPCLQWEDPAKPWCQQTPSTADRLT